MEIHNLTCFTKWPLINTLIMIKSRQLPEFCASQVLEIEVEEGHLNFCVWKREFFYPVPKTGNLISGFRGLRTGNKICGKLAWNRKFFFSG